VSVQHHQCISDVQYIPKSTIGKFRVTTSGWGELRPTTLAPMMPLSCVDDLLDISTTRRAHLARSYRLHIDFARLSRLCSQRLSSPRACVVPPAAWIVAVARSVLRCRTIDRQQLLTHRDCVSGGRPAPHCMTRTMNARIIRRRGFRQNAVLESWCVARPIKLPSILGRGQTDHVIILAGLTLHLHFHLDLWIWFSMTASCGHNHARM